MLFRLLVTQTPIFFKRENKPNLHGKIFISRKVFTVLSNIMPFELVPLSFSSVPFCNLLKHRYFGERSCVTERICC